MVDSERAALIEKAKSFIAQSHLSADDKKLLEGRIPFVADVMIQMFVQVCEEDPFGIDAIVKSLKKKLEAQGNLKKLHEIVKQERRDMDDLLVAG